MKTVLVTGSTGLVGANLVEAVTQHGWLARALRRKTSSLRALQGLTYESAIGDITEPHTLVEAMHGVDIVFHVAAISEYWRVGKDRIYQVNVEGTRNVLQAAKASGVNRVVVTSSAAALGKPPFGTVSDESAQFNLQPDQFHYGYSKHLMEQVVQEYVAGGLDAVIVNPTIVMGPRDVNLISGNILIEEKRIGLRVYPPGGVSVIDVADVCAGHIGAAECGRAGQRYILGGENLWYRDLIAQTAKVVGRAPARIRMPRLAMLVFAGVVDLLRQFGMKLPMNGDQMRLSAEALWFDSGKARRELGLTTRPYRETAQRTYDWLLANGYA